MVSVTIKVFKNIYWFILILEHKFTFKRKSSTSAKIVKPLAKHLAKLTKTLMKDNCPVLLLLKFRRIVVINCSSDIMASIFKALPVNKSNDLSPHFYLFIKTFLGVVPNLFWCVKKLISIFDRFSCNSKLSSETR